MNKCNNCTKFLTCDRKQCNQVTFLQSGQLERVEVKQLKVDREYDFRLLVNGIYKAGITSQQAINNLKQNCLEIKNKEEEKKRWIEK